MDKFMKIDKDFLPIYEFNKTFDEKVKKEGRSEEHTSELQSRE